MQIVTRILKIGWSWYNIHCGPKNPKLSELNGLPVSGNSPRHLNSNLSRQIPFGQWLEKSIAFKTVCATIGGGTWNHENSIMLCRPCGCGHVFFLNSQIYRSLSMVFWQLDELFLVLNLNMRLIDLITNESRNWAMGLLEFGFGRIPPKVWRVFQIYFDFGGKGIYSKRGWRTSSLSFT